MSARRVWLGRAAVAAAVAAVAIQLVPVERSNPPVTGEIAAPAEVHQVFRRACYDCHSHQTVWPWYSRVAPVSWLVAHDVDEGRGELNFSNWTAYTARKQAKKLGEIVEEVDEGNMPPWFYVALHPEARLSEAERELLRQWVASALPPG